MKSIHIKTISVLVLFWANSSLLGDTLTFSLKEAVLYGIDYNLELKASRLELDKAKFRVNEIRSTGLPQFNASLDFRDQFRLPVFVFPDPVSGEQTPIQVGTKYQVIGGFQASQLIFDGTYFLGLKAAKEYKTLASKLAIKTEQDVKIAIAKTYFLALVTRENALLLQQNLITLEANLREVKALYAEGFVEEIEVERLQLAVSNLQVQSAKLNQGYERVLVLLKTYLALPIETPVTLTDNLYDLYTQSTLGISSAASTRIELQILENQLALSKLDATRYKVMRLPSISGFMNLQEQYYGNDLSLNPRFTSALWGMSMRIPLFSSGVNAYQLKQAELTVKQNEFNYRYTAERLAMDKWNANSEFNLANSMVAVQKENYELAQKIQKSAQIKYQEGVGSNLEVVNAVQELKTAQTNYMESIYDLLVSKLNLQIANGQSLQF
jgi:outer membrane protein